ncbi:hypothetical protein ABK040_014082 [Willaertia magna]
MKTIFCFLFAILLFLQPFSIIAQSVTSFPRLDDKQLMTTNKPVNLSLFTCKICKKGETRKANPDFHVKPTGCGWSGELNPISDYYGFTNCCNNHDICYADCDGTKTNCDLNLSSCIKTKCKQIKNLVKRESCLGVAALFSVAVLVAGCGAYKDQQNNACSCVKDNTLKWSKY